MSLQYGAEEAPLAGSYGAADSFPKDFGYGVEEEEEEAAVAGGGVGAGAGGGCGPGGADSSKPRILLMGLRRSGKSSIQKVSGAAPHPCVRPRGPGRPPRGRGPPEEGGGRAGRRAVPPRTAFEKEAEPRARPAPARTPTRESTPRSAEAAGVPAGETGCPGAGARGRGRLGSSPCAVHTAALPPAACLEALTGSLPAPFWCVPLPSGGLRLQGCPGEPWAAASGRVAIESRPLFCSGYSDEGYLPATLGATVPLILVRVAWRV